MLQLLSDKTHIVYTGVCLRNTDKKVVFSNQTNVTFGTLSDHEINYYIDQYNPMDKAGSYGIQEWIGFCKIRKINLSENFDTNLIIKSFSIEFEEKIKLYNPLKFVNWIFLS